MGLEIKTAAELVGARIEARWAARRSGPWAEVLRGLWRLLLERGGSIPIDDIDRLLPGWPGEALAALDADDLIVVRDARVTAAYPFSGEATAFVVILPDGRYRYACCAIDALGIASMLGKRIEVRSRCHHCGEPLAFPVEVDGPADGAEGLMVWVGQWGSEGSRRATSLEEHLRAWRETDPHAAGAATTIGDAVELGRRLFGGLLVNAAPPDKVRQLSESA